MPQKMLYPGYDYEPRDPKEWDNFRKIAERRGNVYQLFVEGYEYANPEEGELFFARSDEEAMERAYRSAWFADRCKMNDRPVMVDNNVRAFFAEYEKLPRYVMSVYRLYNQGRLVHEYAPPAPEDVTAGKVKLI